MIIPQTSEPIKKAIIEGVGASYDPQKAQEPLLDQLFPQPEKITETELGPKIGEMADQAFEEGTDTIGGLIEDTDVESLNLPNKPTNEEFHNVGNSFLELLGNIFQTAKSTHKVTSDTVEFLYPYSINPNILWGIALVGSGILFLRFYKTIKGHLKFLIPFILFVLIALIMIGINIA